MLSFSFTVLRTYCTHKLFVHDQNSNPRPSANTDLLNLMNAFLILVFSFVGEVERLLREYRQNQELVRNIGAHYYQIIYPVQLRHHEKMGISTREVNTQKVRSITVKIKRILYIQSSVYVCPRSSP